MTSSGNNVVDGKIDEDAAVAKCKKDADQEAAAVTKNVAEMHVLSKRKSLKRKRPMLQRKR